MLPELQPLPDGPLPQPGDWVRLNAGTVPGAPADARYLVAQWHEDDPHLYELHHPEDHPQHLDWAAVVTIDAIALVTRQTYDHGTRSWAPPRT